MPSDNSVTVASHHLNHHLSSGPDNTYESPECRSIEHLTAYTLCIRLLSKLLGISAALAPPPPKSLGYTPEVYDVLQKVAQYTIATHAICPTHWTIASDEHKSRCLTIPDTGQKSAQALGDASTVQPSY
jgi:hypothetical protein